MPHTHSRAKADAWLADLPAADRTRLAAVHDQAVALYEDFTRSAGVREVVQDRERDKADPVGTKALQTLALILDALDNTVDRRTSRRLTDAA